MRKRFIFVAIALLSLIAARGSSEAQSSTPCASPPCGWTWMSGSSVVNQLGVYGNEGVTSPTNVPGARVNSVSGFDKSGTFWLFGGYGSDSTSVQGGDLNDLWSYSAGQWTWVSGSNLAEQPGNYGTIQVSAPTNVPGARYQAASWTDNGGNLWVFGGLGIDGTGTRGRLNDLWVYSSGEWTWMSGANVVNQPGSYGTKGVPEPGNIPGARVDASTWTDSNGALWLFGGFGYDSAGTLGILNDLWRYEGGEWTWMKGSNVCNQFGRYGKRGTASAGNVPGARSGANTWIDAAGTLWLFGGQGNDVNGLLCQSGGGKPCDLNDLWKYSNGEWTWVGGAAVIDRQGTYGTLGKSASSNVPGARENAVSWVSETGDFWLFGGFGFDSTATGYGELNDLWRFSGGQWTWISGSNIANQLGVYGEKGEKASSNVPGGRDSAAGWIDEAGDIWVFGGGDFLSIARGGKFNDLWKYSIH